MKLTTTRKTGVSSSKIDAILNKSRYRTALEQYLLDTKQITETLTETSRQKVEMGKIMEPIIKDLVEKALNVQLTVDKNRYAHDELPRFTVEFDAIDYNNRVVYEFKNTEKDEKSIRETYYPQVQFAMYIINFKKARICYLRNGWELNYIDIDRDDNFIEHMIEAGKYYVSCLDNQIEPDLEYLDSIADKINFYRGEQNTLKGVGVELDLTQDDIDLLYQWKDIKSQIDALEFEEQKIKGILSEKYGKYSDSTISYSNVETVRDGGINVKELLKDYPDIDVRKYQKDDTKFSRQVLRLRKRKDTTENIIIKDTEDIV
jgi:predicted phage-related endonuclease